MPVLDAVGLRSYIGSVLIHSQRVNRAPPAVKFPNDADRPEYRLARAAFRYEGVTMDTLSLTINSTILFALGFVAYAVIFETCATIFARKETAAFNPHAYVAATPAFVKPKAGVLVNLPKQKRTIIA